MSDIRLTNYPDEIDNIENMREPTEEELALIQAGNYDALTDDAKKMYLLQQKNKYNDRWFKKLATIYETMGRRWLCSSRNV